MVVECVGALFLRYLPIGRVLRENCFDKVVYAFSVLRRAYACVKRVWMSCGDRDG